MCPRRFYTKDASSVWKKLSKHISSGYHLNYKDTCRHRMHYASRRATVHVNNALHVYY